MSTISVKEALEKIFKGSEKPFDVIKQIRDEDVADLEFILRKMCGKVSKDESASDKSAPPGAPAVPTICKSCKAPGPVFKAHDESGTWWDCPSCKTTGLSMYPEAGLKKSVPDKETIGWSSNGQWTLAKATKEGPTLNYGKINPEQNPISNPTAAKEAKAARYAALDAKARTIDYHDNPVIKPKYTDATEIAAPVGAKLETENGETAIETMARRNQIKPLTPTEKSEKEPHAGDKSHEHDEKNKVKKIKQKAQELLDMHKN